MEMKKGIILLAILSILEIGVLFGQERVLPNKNWSLGLDLRFTKYRSFSFKYEYRGGLFFEHVLYKRFYLSTGSELETTKHTWSSNEPVIENRYSIITSPIDFKCIFLNNKKNTLHT